MSVFDSGENPEETGEEENSGNGEDQDMVSESSVVSDDVINDMEERMSSIRSDMDDFEQIMDDREQNAEIRQSQIEDLEDRVDNLQDDVIELMAIYDLVTSRINPLVSQDIDALVSNLDGSVEVDSEDFFNLKGTEDEIQTTSFDDLVDSIEEELSEQDTNISSEIGEDFEEELRQDIKKNVLEDVRDEIEALNQDQEASSENGSDFQGDDEINDKNVSVPEIRNNLSHEVVTMRWIESIVSEYGSQTFINLLNYYTEIGRISEVARRQITRRLHMGDFDSYKEESEDKEKIPEEVHRVSSKYLNQLSR